MSVVPSELPGGRGKSSVSVFGRKVSTDALLLAGASVVAIILLYRAGRSGTAAAPSPVFAGDGGTFAAPLPSNPLIASAPPPLSDFLVLRQHMTGAGAPGYDLGPATALPLYAVGPSGAAASVGQSPYGGQIQELTTGEQPVTLPWLGSTAQFYAVTVDGQSGYYISAADVAGIVHGPGR